MVTVKSINYGMDIVDEKYLEVINKVNESKDTLLQLVAQVIELTSSKDNSDELKSDTDKKDEENINDKNTDESKDEINE